MHFFGALNMVFTNDIFMYPSYKFPEEHSAQAPHKSSKKESVTDVRVTAILYAYEEKLHLDVDMDFASIF